MLNYLVGYDNKLKREKRMADEVDQANDRALRDNDLCVSMARDAAARIPVGEAGDCDTCGSWNGRLVGGMCSPCRDRYSRMEAINGKP